MSTSSTTKKGGMPIWVWFALVGLLVAFGIGGGGLIAAFTQKPSSQQSDSSAKMSSNGTQAQAQSPASATVIQAPAVVVGPTNVETSACKFTVEGTSCLAGPDHSTGTIYFEKQEDVPFELRGKVVACFPDESHLKEIWYLNMAGSWVHWDKQSPWPAEGVQAYNLTPYEDMTVKVNLATKCLGDS